MPEHLFAFDRHQMISYRDADRRSDEIAAELQHSRDRLALHLHADGVLIGAGHDVGRAADQ